MVLDELFPTASNNTKGTTKRGVAPKEREGRILLFVLHGAIL